VVTSRSCRDRLTEEEIAALTGIAVASVKEWRYRGLLRAHRYSDRGDCLFEAPLPIYQKRAPKSDPTCRKSKLSTIAAKEVQYET